MNFKGVPTAKTGACQIWGLMRVLVVRTHPREKQKTMIRHQDSHLDHGLSAAQIRYLLDRFADRRTFFVETLELPGELGTVPCALWGPAMGDPAIAEDDVIYAPRGPRGWSSRLVDRPTRPTARITVIAGPHEETCPSCHDHGQTPSGRCSEELCAGGRLRHACVLYTAFGGPPAPQEPGDPGCKDPVTSAAFWREHALAK